MLVNFDGPEAVKSTAAHPSKAREIILLFGGSPSLSTNMGFRSPSLSTIMGQRSPSLSTSMALIDLHPCLRAWRKGQGSPSLSTSVGLRDLHPCLRTWILDLHLCLRAWRRGLRSLSLSTSMEKGSGISILVYEHRGKSLSSICFLPHRKN